VIREFSVICQRLYENTKRGFMTVGMTPEGLDRFIEYVRVNMTSYYCKWCGRGLSCEEGVFVHDDVFHPDDYTPECGDEHRLQ
jgi:hypothetical protein